MAEPASPLFAQLLTPAAPHLRCAVAVMQYDTRSTSMVVGCVTEAETAVTTMDLDDWNHLIAAVTHDADLLAWDGIVSFQIKNPRRPHHEHQTAYEQCTAAMLAFVRRRRRNYSLAAAAALAGAILSIVSMYLLPVDNLSARVLAALLPLVAMGCGMAFLYYLALRYMLLSPLRSLAQPLNSAEVQYDWPESDTPPSDS